MNTNLIMGLLTQLVAALTPAPAVTNVWLGPEGVVGPGARVIKMEPPNVATIQYRWSVTTNIAVTDDIIRAWAKSGGR